MFHSENLQLYSFRLDWSKKRNGLWFVGKRKRIIHKKFKHLMVSNDERSPGQCDRS